MITVTIEDLTQPVSTEPALNEPDAFPARLETLIGTLSVRAFARKAGVSDTFLRQCLAGRTEPTRTKLLAIAEAGGTTVEWLATGAAEASAGAESTPSAEAPPARGGGVDVDLLAQILERAEEVLERESPPLSPTRKARLMASLYDMHRHSSAQAVSREAVQRMMTTAA